MQRIINLFVLVALLATTASILPAQEANQGGKRDALHKALVAPLNNGAQRQLVAQQLNLLNDAQVERLFLGLLARIQQLEEIQQRLLAREQAAWNQARQNQWLWMQMMQNRAWGNRAIGYRPIITWLPEGYKSVKELENIQRYAYRKFYLRPSYIIKRILKIRCLEDIKRYIKGGRALVKAFL